MKFVLLGPRREREVRQASRLMVVAHPDDETFWGGGTLAAGSDWGVICLTHAGNRVRRRAFRRAMKVLGAPSIILDVPDRKEHGIPPEDSTWIADQVASFVNADHVEQVMTHGPDGEYGHPLHRAVSAVVTNIYEDPERLWYFNFDEDFDLEIADPSVWRRKMRAVDCYLGSDASGWDPADRCHVDLGRHESPVRASDYERPWALVSRIYARSGMVIT